MGVRPRYLPPEPLTTDHELGEFSSGDGALDEWLRRFALVNQTSGSARTYVVVHAEARRVVGYYAISSGAVARNAAPARVAKTMPEPVPVLLLGRLAVDLSEQGQGLGAHLLRDAILRTVQVADQVGVRALLAHAVNGRAASFYERFDFSPSPTDPLHMLLLLKDARALLRRTAAPDQ